MLMHYNDHSMVVNSDGSRRNPKLHEVFRRLFLVFFDTTAGKAWRIDSNPKNISSIASRYHLITALRIAYLVRGGDINDWVEPTPLLSSARQVRKYRSKAMQKPEINYHAGPIEPFSVPMDHVAPIQAQMFDIRRGYKRKASNQGSSSKSRSSGIEMQSRKQRKGIVNI